MTIEVLLCMSFSRASCTSFSEAASRAEVASSSTKIAGSFRMARAMESRCFCPPESFPPRSPIGVSYPCGSARIKSCALATFAASIMAASLASGLPKQRLFATVSLNRMGSCVTTPIVLLRSFFDNALMLIPSSVMAPSSTS